MEMKILSFQTKKRVVYKLLEKKFMLLAVIKCFFQTRLSTNKKIMNNCNFKKLYQFNNGQVKINE